jgi:hypothetical protein
MQRDLNLPNNDDQDDYKEQRPRAQQAPNVLTRRISLYLCRFPTLLRPRTGALRHDLLPLSLTHYIRDHPFGLKQNT